MMGYEFMILSQLLLFLAFLWRAMGAVGVLWCRQLDNIVHFCCLVLCSGAFPHVMNANKSHFPRGITLQIALYKPHLSRGWYPFLLYSSYDVLLGLCDNVQG